MNWIEPNVLGVLWFLLPGFVASWVYSGLTSYPRRNEFERVVQALIFTGFAQVITLILRFRWPALEQWFGGLGQGSIDGARGVSFVAAIVIGLFFAFLANHDILHTVLRWCKITHQTGYPSEWFGVFRDRSRTHVILHLDGERRLYGWPEEWPTDPGRGHFSMAHAHWLDEKNNASPLTGVDRILVPASEVSFVEFMDKAELPTAKRGVNIGTQGTPATAQAAGFRPTGRSESPPSG